MTKSTKMLFRVFLTCSLLLALSTTYFAQTKSVKSVLDHTSNIVVNGTAEGKSVTYTYSGDSKTNFAGVISGTLNGTTTVKFYCIDLLHEVNSSQHPTYWDQGTTPAEMTYILNNYFPFKTSYTGKLSDTDKEAASIQLAIWHFSDGVDASTITDATIKSRTLAIIADASANANNAKPLETLIIVPAAQSYAQGTPASFNIYALDLDGNPVSGLSVALSTSLGSLSAVSGTTDANGKLGSITLTYSGTGTAVITARATVPIAQGTVYVDKTNPTTKQKIVLASPTTDLKEVNATVTWYVPSGCDTKGFTTFTQGGWGSSSNSVPGTIRDQYFSTVFPSGLTVGGIYKLTLTSAAAVKNYLPDGGTAAAYTQNYSNPTSNINVLSGQLTALKLNTAFSAAGKLGSNTTKLGDLVIATGPFTGKTVSQFLAMAETAIGGGSLNGFTLSQYNDAATSINENFDNGTVDKGFLSCASSVCKDKIGGVLYRDKNANGSKDSGELGIAGVILQLLQGSTVISTDTTDANGAYLFQNLTNGTYTVKLASSNFASGGVFFNTDQVKWYTKGSTSTNSTVNCNDNLSINFGYYKTCVGVTKTADKTTYKVGDVVTYTITVENCGDIQLHGGVDVYDTMLFGSNPYHIDVIDPGQTFTIPVSSTKYTVKSADCGDLVNTVRAEGHPVDGSATVTASTSITVKVDCTVCKNTVGSYVYRDLNQNGTKDSGEAGIANVVVELVQGSTVISTVTTDANGAYAFGNLLNGSYTVRIAASNFASGGVFYNTDQVKWYTKNSSSVNTTLNCNDNLSINFGYYKTCVSITKSADKASYNSGDTITYSFLVENCGDVQLHGGIDIFDAMLNSAGDNLIKHIDVLEPHTSTTFTMTYKTADKDCGQLTNTVRAEGHPVDGSATVKDVSTWTVSVICSDKADVKVEKSASTSNPTCNSNFTYTIKVTNQGPNTAKSVQVTDLLPSGLTYVSNSASQGSYDNTTGIWNVGDLANNAYATLNITVKVDCGQVNNSVFDLGAAKDYNLFVIEDATQPSADTQGKVAVGRDAQFATYSIGDQLPANSGDVLVVGRDLTYTSGAIYNGNVAYGHATNLPASAVSITGGSLRKDSPINFASAKVALQSLSTSLSAYTVNGTTNFQYGGLTLTGTDPYLNVFAVTGSNLSSANSVQINVPNGSAVLVNINGSAVTWMGGLVVNGTAITNVLYNFYQASTLTIQGIDVKGSILAPFAAVNFAAGVQNGQMICLSLTGSGQFNYSPFGGYIPVDKQITNVALVSSCLTTDPNPGNNSASATVTVNGTSNNGGSGNNGGSNNNGGSWSNVCSFGAGEIVYSLAYGSDGSIYAGTWGGKIYKSTNNGTSWTVINAGMNVSFIWSLNISGGYIFAATEQGVYKFNGTTWTLTTLAGKDVHALVSYNGTIYAATWGFGIYKSTDNGSSWIQINSGLNGFLAIQSLTVYNGGIYAGTSGGGVFKCTNGTDWTKLGCGYTAIWSMASTSSAVLAGTYGDGLYRSLDGGLSWTKTSLNISFVYSISVNLSGKIYVSSLTNGVFTSTDNGATWNSIGMDGYGVSSLLVSTTTNNVYVGTKEGKMFMTNAGTNNATAIEENNALPTEFKLEQNYPNPFNPTTKIQFAVPQAGSYTLKVYNVLGQEVAELMNKELQAGVHTVNFDATKLASGMYIYRLNGSSVNMTKKMILIK